MLRLVQRLLRVLAVLLGYIVLVFVCALLYPPGLRVLAWLGVIGGFLGMWWVLRRWLFPDRRTEVYVDERWH